MPTVLVLLITLHIAAVLAKLSLFFAIPRLKSVEHVKAFLRRYRPFERSADVTLWVTGASLIYFASWKLLFQSWMLISLGLYLLVFLLIRFVLTRELRSIAQSKKLLAAEELGKLRVSNWCVGIIAAVFLAVIAYLMMTKP